MVAKKNLLVWEFSIFSLSTTLALQTKLSERYRDRPSFSKIWKLAIVPNLDVRLGRVYSMLVCIRVEHAVVYVDSGSLSGSVRSEAITWTLFIMVAGAYIDFNWWSRISNLLENNSLIDSKCICCMRFPTRTRMQFPFLLCLSQTCHPIFMCNSTVFNLISSILVGSWVLKIECWT